MKNILYYVQNFTSEYIEISFWILLALTCSFVAYWFYNRKRIQNLSHQIPAAVVKNYLDSIIQNSTALKSSLFRGGGLEVGEGIPSVKPVNSLNASSNVQLSSGSSEELTQKSAEIAALKSQLMDKENLLAELEKNLEELESSSAGEGDSSHHQAKIEELEASNEELKAQLNSSSADEAVKAQLEAVTAERDELKEKLMEYEIIEEDLANLKKLQKENEQLKNTIAQLEGGQAAPGSAPVEEVAVAEVEEAPEEIAEEVEEVSVSEEVAEVQAVEEDELPDNVETLNPQAAELAQADDDLPEAPADEGNDSKSAEELLSEFEKMLG